MYVQKIPIRGIFKEDIKLSGKKIILLDLTHMMSMANLVAIRVTTPRIDSWCSLEKDFSKLIYMNP